MKMSNIQGAMTLPRSQGKPLGGWAAKEAAGTTATTTRCADKLEPVKPMPLPPPLGGAEIHFIDVAGVQVALHVAKPPLMRHAMTPLLLVHSVNATASAVEMRALFDAMSHDRPVVAIELPGFGHSERCDIAYSPALMARAVAAAVRWVGDHLTPAAPDVVALSLGCEFATLAVLNHGAKVRSLTLISPTGAERRRQGEAWQGGRTRCLPAWRRLLRHGAFGRALFGLLTSRLSMRWFLSRTWGSRRFDPLLLAHGWLSAHAKGAQHAPLDFVAGELFSRGIVERYAELQVPVWLAHGHQGAFTDFGALDPIVARHGSRWQRTCFDAGAMPQAQCPADFAAALHDFLACLPPECPPTQVARRWVWVPQPGRPSRSAHQADPLGQAG